MSIRMLHGDCREVLKTLPDASVHCCVTSPPYFGLRDYGTAQWEGGDAECEHTSTRRNHGEDEKQGTQAGSSRDKVGRDCRRCGARRIDSQIGLEPTPDEYVAELVGVFREVRRVLRDDGTLWLNLGDSYASSASNGGQHDFSSSGLLRDGRSEASRLKTLATAKQNNRPQPGTRRDLGALKPKDLIGIPWRVAFALQADGWWLRQDIIWAKPNPMPESVTDRCTKAHEYMFLLSKSAKYYFDAEAIAEPAIYSPDNTSEVERAKGYYNGKWNEPHPGTKRNDTSFKAIRETRNRRSVWTVTTQPFSEAHFATFPPDLIEPCIKAGCPTGGLVLDPFGGAGTTGLVADRLGRNATLIELNPAYAAMATTRIKGDAPLFTEVA